MAQEKAKKKSWGPAAMGLACLVVAAGLGWALWGKQSESLAKGTADGAITGSVSPAVTTGASGLPIPRFVSLKAEKVNVRRGPSSEHPVAWVFQRKGLPIEIVAEFDNWRRVRDSDGEEGWILQSMLSGKRTAMVAPWRADKLTPLHDDPKDTAGVVANLASGAMSEIDNCDGSWCELTAGGYKGYVKQEMLWGVYPGEKVN